MIFVIHNLIKQSYLCSMKIFVNIFTFYLLALTILPSVRAVKLYFHEKCESGYNAKILNKQENSSCEKSKIIMSLSFEPLKYETANSFDIISTIPFLEISKKEIAIYKEVFISQYNISIWQPPKIINLV